MSFLSSDRRAKHREILPVNSIVTVELYRCANLLEKGQAFRKIAQMKPCLLNSKLLYFPSSFFHVNFVFLIFFFFFAVYPLALLRFSLFLSSRDLPFFQAYVSSPASTPIWSIAVRISGFLNLRLISIPSSAAKSKTSCFLQHSNIHAFRELTTISPVLTAHPVALNQS